jgi:hypothetical protein
LFSVLGFSASHLARMVAFEGRDKLASVLEVIGWLILVGCEVFSILMGESMFVNVWLLVSIIERYSHIPAAFRGDASWMRSYELWCHAEDTYRRESGVDGDGSPAPESGGGVGLTPLVKPGKGSREGDADDKVTVVVMDGDRSGGAAAGAGGRELRTVSGGAGNKLADALAGKAARPTVAVVEAGSKRTAADSPGVTRHGPSSARVGHGTAVVPVLRSPARTMADEDSSPVAPSLPIGRMMESSSSAALPAAAGPRDRVGVLMSMSALRVRDAESEASAGEQTAGVSDGEEETCIALSHRPARGSDAAPPASARSSRSEGGP